MKSKIWEKNIPVHEAIEAFTVGNDRAMDVFLAKADVIGSLAHCTMLASVGLLTNQERDVLLVELKKLYRTIEEGQFIIEEGVEDVHSQVELTLTQRLGDVGKKIHSGRSRNDQVLLDLKLFTRDQLKEIVQLTDALIDLLLALSNQHAQVLMPGYTHLQIAMPSSFGLWFGAYAESLTDDLQWLLSAWKLTNRNPLGSAAGYGSSFPLNRQLTTDLLGFDGMNVNVVYAQMTRGKMERTVASALAGVAATLSRLAYDACLYHSQNFGFIRLPDAFTTGSSIMPHKKNPDVFELTRAKCNKIQSLPYQISLITNNLPSGYFRDMQMVKEIIIPAFSELTQCLKMTQLMMEKMEVNTHILDDPKYHHLFSVEAVNALTLQGVPFRDAYQQVGASIEKGEFVANKNVHHTHEGSLGNLCNEKIAAYKDSIVEQFQFGKVQTAIDSLLKD